MQCAWEILIQGAKMRNFAKLQKSAKLQKNADSKIMHIKRINIQRNKYFYQQAQHKAQQRNKKCCAADFKGFFRRNKRNTTASVVAQHQPPHPPFRGVGFVAPEPLRFLFTFGAYAVPEEGGYMLTAMHNDRIVIAREAKKNRRFYLPGMWRTRHPAKRFCESSPLCVSQ